MLYNGIKNQGGGNMRKYLVGMVFGLILGLAVTAYGSGMIGKVVDTTYPVFIEGQRAEMDAIAIEGVSYLPTRYIAESVGYTVAFVNEQIVLTEPVEAATVVPETVTETPLEEVKPMTINKYVCDILDLDTPYIYKVIDGEWFYPPVAFIKYLTNDGNIYTINLPWKTIAIDAGKEYSPGMDGGKIDGRVFVSLSSVGLKPIIDGDTVTLVRTE
jgi:hypothetical protein